MTPEQHSVFWKIHQDLPREGPGSPASTRRAWALLDALPERPRVLDVGCGPGAQTLELARSTDAEILAVDNHLPYVERLRASAAAEGLAERVTVRQGDMFGLDLPSADFDTVWAEGSIYIIGFERGLREWAVFLKDGGHIAVSELTWLDRDAPEELRRFWHEAYPAMRDVAGNLAVLESCGFEEVGHFALPESAFWDDYYTPIEKRLELLAREYEGDREALEVLDNERYEIELFRKYARYYSYVFYVGRKR